MTLRKIAYVGEPILRQRAEELSEAEIKSERVQVFIDDLVETMRDANGAGLAANQVYTPWRICAVEVRTPNPRYPYKPGIPLTVMINPEIELHGDETFENYEGCLSVPDLRGVVRRHARATVRYLDRDGHPHEIDVAGVTAGTYQHELDHLDGKLFLDRVEDPTTLCTWKAFQRYHEAGFAERVRGLVEKYGS